MRARSFTTRRTTDHQDRLFSGDDHIEGNIYRAGLSRNVLSEESAIGVHAYQGEIRQGAPPLARAMVVRGNRLEQDAHIEIKGSSSVAPGVRDVIIEWNGQPVDNATTLRLMIGRAPVGSQVKVVIVRDGQEVTKTVRVAELPRK